MNSEEMYLRMKKFFLDHEVANFYRYLESMESNLDSMAQQTSIEVQNIKQEIRESGESVERRKELLELLGETSRIEGFANLMRQSFFVSLYAFLELWLLRECRIEGKRREDVKLSLSDLRGTGIEKGKVYLSKVLGLQFSFGTSSEWEKIKKYKLLRNCIVHRQGSLTGLSNLEVNRSLEQFVKDEEGLSLHSTGSQVVVKHEFCAEAMLVIHKFLTQILVTHAT